MDEMPRPLSLPSSTPHDQHDALLVARAVADDLLDDIERRTADTLLATCPACASLAADLRTLSVAVSQEPVPSRRRDFRIPPARARELRGDRLQRALRRLALPQAGTLRPVAAGVMSLGLLLVVAGNVWPEDTLLDRPVSQPRPEALASQAPVQGLTLETLEAQAPDPAGEPGEAATEAGMSGLDSGTDTSTEAADTAGSEDAGDAAPRGAGPLPQQGFAEDASLEDGAPAKASPSALEGLSRSQALEVGTEDDERVVPEEAHAQRDGDAGVDAPPPVDVPAAGVVADDAQAAEELADTPADSGVITLPTLLLVLGAILAVAGVALLLVSWAARRYASDPLLR